MTPAKADSAPALIWKLPGANQQPILGNTNMPSDRAPIATVILAHGFKGYKDYGMFPVIAAELAARGFITHRFNFSHSGMTDSLERFERPDLFELDTWNKQVEDLLAVLAAIRSGEIAGRGLPVVLTGHSRGGVVVLLTMGRHGLSLPEIKGVVSIAAPDSCQTLSDDEARLLLDRGWIQTISSRTGQNLRIGRAWLEEQRADAHGHDLRAMTQRILVPVLAIHGEADATVDAQCADRIAKWASHGSANIVRGADHVFNTPNPVPAGSVLSPELRQLVDELGEFIRRCQVASSTHDSAS